MAESYLIFTEVPTKKKTRHWKVTSTSGVSLGEIRFYPRWRQYVFAPSFETLFNDGCLAHVEVFLAERTKEWQDEVKARHGR